MLVLRRTEGQWVNVTHRASNDLLRFRVYDIQPGRLYLAFEDKPNLFNIQRPERRAHPRERYDD